MAQAPRRTVRAKKNVAKTKTSKNSENTNSTNTTNNGTANGANKSTTKKKKKNEFDRSTNHLITDYYKVTRRKTTKTLKEEQDQVITYYIKNDVDDIKSLKIQEFNDKGRGIVTTRKFTKGSFICEYRGDLIAIQKAKAREKLYESQQLGCYMYYFSWSNKQWCIDATADTGRLGRLINHSRKKPNLKTKLFILNDVPHLIFVALEDIDEDTELLYDYESDINMAYFNQLIDLLHYTGDHRVSILFAGDTDMVCLKSELEQLNV